MKSLKNVFILFVMLGSTSMLSAQGSGPAFSLTITLPHSEVRPNSSVELDVTKKNISTADLPVSTIVGTAEDDYDVIVTDDQGKSALETKYGRKVHGKEPYHGSSHSWFIRTLKPGEEIHEHVLASRIYDFSRPGQYTVQVSQTVYASEADAKAGAKTTIKSNPVTLTVTN